MSYAALFTLILSVTLAACAAREEPAPPFEEVRFDTADGGRIFANRYGKADHAVVLAHGAVFDKESWDPFARTLAEQGFQALALDFRGYGKSTPGSRDRALYEDVLAAIRFLRDEGSRRVSVIGASMGGAAAGQAAVEAEPGRIHRLILLSPGPIENPREMKADKILFIASEDEGNASRVRALFEQAPQPKSLEMLPGDAHAQHLFKTGQAERLTDAMIDFLR
jgi:pimeloyl-ACP methyl ester carboxylesterase